MTISVVRFSASVDPDLLEEFDETVRTIGHTRSTAIQIAMRNFLTEHMWEVDLKAKIVGAIIIIYEHDAKGLGETLNAYPASI